MPIPNGPCGLCRGKGKRIVTNIRTMKVDWRTCCDCDGSGWIGPRIRECSDACCGAFTHDPSATECICGAPLKSAALVVFVGKVADN